jgi:hypothetical protein
MRLPPSDDVRLAPPVPTLTHDEVVEHARAIVRGDELVADPVNDPDWRSSLALLLGLGEGAVIPENLGCILVPVDVHRSSPWLNGHVPAMTMRAFFVAAESVEALQAEVERMHAALHPEET